MTFNPDQFRRQIDELAEATPFELSFWFTVQEFIAQARAALAEIERLQGVLREVQMCLLGEGGIPHGIGPRQSEIISKMIDAALDAAKEGV